MNFNVLRYVVAVAQERSFTRAAQQLYISQPTLSQSIQALENKLGTPLFDRKTNPISLTYAGKLYVDWAQDMLLSESQMNRRLSAVADEGKSQLYIGVSPHRSTFMVPDIARQMVREFPDCRLSFVEGNSAELYQRMEQRELDLMIHNAPADTVRYTSIVVNTERILLAVPAEYRIEGKPPRWAGDYPSVRLLQVRDRPFIALGAQFYMGHSVRALCELEDFTPIYGIECGRVELAQELVGRGLGVTLLPEFFVRFRPALPGVDYFTIAKSDPRRDLCLVYRKESCLTEPALRFIELLQQKFGHKGMERSLQA